MKGLCLSVRFVPVPAPTVVVVPPSTSTTLTEQSVSEDVSVSMPGRACQDVLVVHATERVTPLLDDNVVRYVNSPVTHDASPVRLLMLFLRAVRVFTLT